MKHLILTLAILTLVVSCKQNESSFKIQIQSPLNESQFDTKENIQINIKPLTFNIAQSTMIIYVDDIKIAELIEYPYEYVIEKNTLTVGEHTLKIVVSDLENVDQFSVNFSINDLLELESDLLIFQNEIPSSTSITGWLPNSDDGVGDNNSIKSNQTPAIFKLKKTFETAGNIRFYLQNQHKGNTFYIDGNLVSESFNSDQWKSYSYYVSAGTHTFRWEADSAETSLDSISFNPGHIQHSIGEHYGGGVIFFLEDSKKHGLIAAKKDLCFNGDLNIPWGCEGLTITSGNKGLDGYCGAFNTDAILTDCLERPIAVSVCADYSVTQDGITYDDWYLPTEHELLILYPVREIVGNFDFNGCYWASNIAGDLYARMISYSDGSVHGAKRSGQNGMYNIRYIFRTRAIRQF